MVFNIRKISWTKIMNKRGSRIEPCGVTDSIFYHELQEEFIFLYGFVTGADLGFEEGVAQTRLATMVGRLRKF